jgi:hypothetical protein
MQFETSELEQERIDKWIKKHKKKCYRSDAGRFVTYSFTPRAIGTIVKVKCSCGKEKDVTDVDNW